MFNYLPAKHAMQLLPLHMGIIEDFRVRYRRKLVRKNKEEPASTVNLPSGSKSKGLITEQVSDTERLLHLFSNMHSTLPLSHRVIESALT